MEEAPPYEAVTADKTVQHEAADKATRDKAAAVEEAVQHKAAKANEAAQPNAAEEALRDKAATAEETVEHEAARWTRRRSTRPQMSQRGTRLPR